MTDEIITVEKEPETHRMGWVKFAILLFIIAIVMLLGCFGYGYYQLLKLNVGLEKTVTNIEGRLLNDQSNLGTLKKQVMDLEQVTQKSQDLSAQQEQLMGEWRAAQKGDLDNWHIAEAEYLAKLANDHLMYSHNGKMAQTLLAQADHILGNIQGANVLELRKSIATDLASLQAAPDVDVTSLYLQLSGLNNALDVLPLPAVALTRDGIPVGNQLLDKNLPWWKAGWERTLQALRQIVIVRYNGSKALPLIMPDEKAYLYLNLHAQLESAMWAVLHRDQDVYQASLLRTSAWIQQYFVQDAAATTSTIKRLDDLQKINIQPPTTNLSATLQLFDNYFAQIKKDTNVTQSATTTTTEGAAQ
jgi:uroporphyrin-3 C-methyltransferase